MQKWVGMGRTAKWTGVLYHYLCHLQEAKISTLALLRAQGTR